MIIKIKKNMVSKVIFIEDGKILLLKRAKFMISKDAPWSWDLPGGHREPCELMREAARRESKEETNLTPRELKFVSSKVTGDGDHRSGKYVYFYKALSWTGEIELSDEHSEYRWVPLDEISEYKNGIGTTYYEAVLRVSQS